MESKVFNIDCMVGMAEYPDKYFDLAIVDSPYGLGDKLTSGGTWSVKWQDKGADWDKIPDDKYFKELFRVSKNWIIWGGNYFVQFLPNCRNFIAWHKPYMDGMHSMSNVELALTSFDKNAKFISINKDKGTDERIHVTQKPVKLYKWILDNYAVCKHCKNEGGFYEDVVGDGGSRMYIECESCDVSELGNPKILDTHLGSGSSRIACYERGFDFTGFELDKDYFEAAEKRYQNHIKQLKMF